MTDDRFRARLGLCAFALATLGAFQGAPAARATPAPVAQATPVPLPSPLRTPAGANLGGNQPTPYPINTLAPLTGQTSLPYPAYGTPVPGVDSGVPAPDVSALLPLSQAVLIGFARAPALASARADVGIQNASVRLARAGLLPSVSAAVSLDGAHNQAGSGLSTGTNLGTGTGTTAGTATQATRTVTYNDGVSVSISQLIYDGGRIAASVQAAQRSETSSADVYRRDLQTVAYNIAVAYYNYLSAQRTTQVDLEIVRLDQVQEDLVRAQVRAGTEARAQIATAQLPTAQARLAVVRAQGAELSAEAAFANAMGLDANVKVQPVDDAPVFTNSQVSSIPIPSYDEAIKRAFALRPDYDSALQSVAQAQYQLKSARLGLFPTLSGSGTAADNSSDGRLGSYRNSQQLGLSLSIPIFDQGITAANTAQASAQVDRARAQLQLTAINLQLNIKQTLVNVVSSGAALTQTEQEYATAISNVRSTQAQYRAGVTTLPLLLNAQVQLTQALTDQVSAVYALRLTEQAYLYAVGSNYDTSAGIGKPKIDPAPASGSATKSSTRRR